MATGSATASLRSIPTVIRHFPITGLTAGGINTITLTGFDPTYTGLTPRFVLLMPQCPASAAAPTDAHPAMATYDPDTLTYFLIDIWVGASTNVLQYDLWLG